MSRTRTTKSLTSKGHKGPARKKAAKATKKVRKKSSEKAEDVAPFQQAQSGRVTILEHFSNVRKALISLYENSKSASHGVVQGALREGFVQTVLRGHLGDALAWSSGQIVTAAPENWQSGQLDLIIHRGDSPQIHLHDGFIRLIPSSAAIAVIEVKSNLTTGSMQAGKSSALLHALDSLCDAIRARADLHPIETVTGLGDKEPLPSFLVAFTSGQTPEKIAKKVKEYLTERKLDEAAFWPSAILVLSGGAKAKDGFVIARDLGERLGGKRLSSSEFAGKAYSVIENSPVAAFLCLLSRAVTASWNTRPADLCDYVYPKIADDSVSAKTRDAAANP